MWPCPSGCAPRKRPGISKRAPTARSSSVMARGAAGALGSAVLDHRADHLAPLHGAEGLVHLAQLDAAADHPLEIQLAVLPEPQQAIEVEAHVGAPEHRALQVLLVIEHLEGVELDLFGQAADADDYRRAAAPGDVEALADQLRAADALDRIVEALAAGDGSLGAVDAIGLDRMGGAELLSQLELRGYPVDGHDLGAR